VSDQSAGMSQIQSRWIDISIPIQEGMVNWPGDEPVRVETTHSLENGDSNNLSSISMSSHTGTHMDAPLHFIHGDKGIDELPLDIVIGRARIIEILDTESVKPGELSRHKIHGGERVLLKTYNSYHNWSIKEFNENFVHITVKAARYLAACGIKLLGVDYLSVGGYKGNGDEVHKTLLEAGIWIIEGLNLSHVEPGKYDLICLPLKIVGADGAPARAILRSLKAAEPTNGQVRASDVVLNGREKPMETGPCNDHNGSPLLRE